MLTELQKTKIHHLFNVLDWDKNGYLQPQDFVNVGNSVIIKTGIEPKSREAKLIRLKSNRLFIQLLTDLGLPELSISLWDWISFFRDQIESPDKRILDHYIYSTSRYIFTLFDFNRDNFISREEYFNLFSIYKLDIESCNIGFEELDGDHDNQISVEELIEGLENYFKSTDPFSRGNLIFGPY